MGKTLKYVSEFSFPSDKGYSGSAGKQMVKGYARGGSCGMAKGGNASAKMDRLKGVIGNERKEITRVEAKQRDAGQELSRVRSEMRYDKNEMKGMRKQYPTNRSEPMIAMKKGGHVSKKIMKKFDGGYIQDPASSGVPQGVSPLTQIANPQAQPALQNMIPPGNTSLSPTAMKRGGKVGAKLVKMANGGALPPGAAGSIKQTLKADPRRTAQDVLRGPPMPQRPMPEPPRPPVQNVDPRRPVLPPRPSTQPRPPVPPDLQTPMPRPGGTFQADMGRPDMPGRPLAPGATPPKPYYQIDRPDKQSGITFADKASYDHYMNQQRSNMLQQERQQLMERMRSDMTQQQRQQQMERMRSAMPQQQQGRQYIATAIPGTSSVSAADRAIMDANRSPNEYRRPIIETAPMETPEPLPQRPLAPGATPRPPIRFANKAAYDQYMQQATGAGRLGLGSAPMGRPEMTGPKNIMRPPSSVNTTTQSDMMGRNQRPAGGFNPANTQQGLQQLAARNNPQQMGRPAMAKGGMLYSKKEVNAKNLLGEGKAPPLPHARGSVNMAKGGAAGKVGKVMGEFKAGDLHSGKNGPVVKSRKQAIAIGLSEARRAKK